MLYVGLLQKIKAFFFFFTFSLVKLNNIQELSKSLSAQRKSGVRVKWAQWLICHYVYSRRKLWSSPIKTLDLAWRVFKRPPLVSSHSRPLINCKTWTLWHLHFLFFPSPDHCVIKRGVQGNPGVSPGQTPHSGHAELRPVKAWSLWGLWVHGKPSVSAVTGFCGNRGTPSQRAS